MALHNELGKAGENAAVEFLQRKGYVIRHRNWKCGRKELDIVASHNGVLIIVEVKTRNNNCFGSPIDAVTDTKIKRIMMAANAYVKFFRMDCPVRFDILSVINTTHGFSVEHVEDAFASPIW